MAGCGGPRPFTIANRTAEDVVLVGCAQEPNIDRVIASNGDFTFSDNIGERTLSDDPGFACLLRLGSNELRCLQLPTDQSRKTTFAVSEATPTDSFKACVGGSRPHLWTRHRGRIDPPIGLTSLGSASIRKLLGGPGVAEP